MVKRLIQSQDFNGPWVTELQLLNGSWGQVYGIDLIFLNAISPISLIVRLKLGLYDIRESVCLCIWISGCTGFVYLFGCLLMLTCISCNIPRLITVDG